MGQVAQLWRHPIKSHGREALGSVKLSESQCMPWDRHWAVTHEKSKFDPQNPEWVHCANFMRGMITPGLAGIWAELDEATATVTLRHEALGEVQIAPDQPEDFTKFRDWVAPICTTSQQPTAIVKAPGRGMTDSGTASVSIMTMASHRSVEGRVGRKVEVERWRGNIWLDGPAPWEEMEWVGKDLRIGTAVMHIRKPIVRCAHTMANPKTGLRDTDLPAVLRDGWRHEDFGVQGVVIKSGTVAVGDSYEVL